MPRADPTFSDSDLLRFYCRNLEAGEKYRVLQRFTLYIGKGEKICPADTNRPNPCEWIEILAAIIGICASVSNRLPQVILALTAWEAALALLSWAGPLGRILNLVRAVIAYLIAILTYATALLVMIEKFALLVEFMAVVLCRGDTPPPLGRPPDLDDLPPDPQRIIDDLMDQIRDFQAWLQDWLAANPGWDVDPTV